MKLETSNMVKQILDKITNSKVITEKSIIGNYIIAKRGMHIRYPGSNNQYFIGGFSCRQKRTEAEMISQYELAERILATYYFSNPNARDNHYPVFSPTSHKILGNIDADNALLGPTIKNPANKTDAVGLSYHAHLNNGIEHAINELIERHILGLIWYEKWPIIKLSENIIDDYHIHHFTIRLSAKIPFSMCIAFDRNLNFLCLGASLSVNPQQASDKAQSEAIMLATDIVNMNNFETIANKISKSRMLSQRDSQINLQRKKYLDEITETTQLNEPSPSYQIKDILKLLSLESDDIGYCVLHTSEQGHVIRAISHKLKTLAMFREKYKDTHNYLLEPVC